jgi:hypothetical protein
MKVMIVCSTNFYGYIDKVKKDLENNNHEVILPNCYDAPVSNDDNKLMSEEEYLSFFRDMFYESRDKVSLTDAILVLNYDKEKNGNVLKNYVGASTFLEMYEAFMQDKKIYMMNDIPDNMLYDEIKGFNPIILNGNCSLVKED